MGLNSVSFFDFFSLIFTGLFSLLGVVVGAALAKSHSDHTQRRKELIDCYAQFFKTYTEFVAQQTIENKGRVIYALEVAKLLCPSDSAKLFREFERSILRGESVASRKDLVDQIRDRGQRDLTITRRRTSER